MKKILLLCLLLLKLSQSFSQTPNLMRYQGVARSTSGMVQSNSTIKLRFTIRDGAANGVPVYTEIRSVTTDSRGMFVCFIGGSGASGQSSSLGALNWANTTKFLQVEMDPLNGVNFINLGAQQLATNPYARFSDFAGSLSGGGLAIANINAGSAMEGQVLQFNGTQWVPAYLASSSLPMPYTGTANSTLDAFTLTNSGNSVPLAVDAMQEGIRVTTANGTALQANSVGTAPTLFARNYGAGTGLEVSSPATAGAAVKAENTNNGLALSVSGNVRLSGGNTNPQNGAILMSDEVGNARWRGFRSAFQATNSSAITMASKNTGLKLQLYTKTFDLANNYYNAGDTRFTAPVAGVYHFFADALVSAIDYGTFYNSPDLEKCTLEIRIFRNGTKINSYTQEMKKGDRKCSFFQPRITTDFLLKAGDVVDLYLSAKAATVKPVISTVNFSGKLQITEY